MVARRASPPSNPSAPAPVSLPKLIKDPVWSLKIWPVTVEIQRDSFEIPAMCAADWLALLMKPELSSYELFPGLLSADDQSRAEVLLHQGAIPVEDFTRLGFELVSEVTGRPWWVAMRLVGVAVESWDALGGEMGMKADATRLSLAAWLDILYLLILRNIDDSKRNMFLLRLEQVPEGWESGEPEVPEMTADAFLAMASQ